jgi:hypothetical protein
VEIAENNTLLDLKKKVGIGYLSNNFFFYAGRISSTNISFAD